ncbi:MAG TPA: hypothetical protein VII98_04550 [Solirubrobacteraceae bacterium]
MRRRYLARVCSSTSSSLTASAIRRSEVIGVRRSCETAATSARRASSAASRALLGGEALDHDVRRVGELGELVTAGRRDVHVAPPLPDGEERIAHMLDVAQHAVGENLRGDDRDEAGEGDDQRDEQGVLVADKHQQRDRHDGDERLAHHDRHRQRELPAERAQPPSTARRRR